MTSWSVLGHQRMAVTIAQVEKSDEDCVQKSDKGFGSDKQNLRIMWNREKCPGDRESKSL